MVLFPPLGLFGRAVRADRHYLVVEFAPDPCVHGYGWGFTATTMVSGNVFYRDVLEGFHPRAGHDKLFSFFDCSPSGGLDMLFYSHLFLV